MAAAQLTAGLIDAFIKSFDTVLVDCDGMFVNFFYNKVMQLDAY